MYEKGSASLMSFSLAEKTKQLVTMASKTPISVHNIARNLSVINKDANHAIHWCVKTASHGCTDSSIKQLHTYAKFVIVWMADIERAIKISDIDSMQLWTKNGYRQALKKYYTLYSL